MNIFYEENGQFKTATVIQKSDSTYQADTQHGKRVKIKISHVFLEFTGDLNAFLEQAQTQAQNMDIELLWEACSEEEFNAQDLASEYYGQTPPTALQHASTLMVLYSAPMYFYKKAKGIFKSASADTLKQALMAIERKKQTENQIAQWVEQLQNNIIPPEIAKELKNILHAPDKQSPTYQAFQRTAESQKLGLIDLAKKLGAIRSQLQLIQERFEIKYFPNGTGFAPLPDPIVPPLPRAENIKAFSIDDDSTTEIDDAFSVQNIGNSTTRIGIHIASPTLAMPANGDAEKWVLTRHSTVYFPTGKITMLPEPWIRTFSLDEGKWCPCFSIYFDIDDNWQIQFVANKIEQVFIDKNLRIEHIEPFFNSANGISPNQTPQFPYHTEAIYLYQLAIELQKQRNRYDPNPPKQYDYSFQFAPDGTISIKTRERGSPIDTLVSEMMILANSTWAKQLDENGLGGIFRAQNGGSVRTTTKAEPHQGMGVNHYGWFTSPLRRASDCVNQQQLHSLIEQRPPRFAHNDGDLFAVARDFEATYSAYQTFQRQQENYWAIKYLEQEQLNEIHATLIKEDLVRLIGVPLITRAIGIPFDALAKSKLKLAINQADAEAEFIELKYINMVP